MALTLRSCVSALPDQVTDSLYQAVTDGERSIARHKHTNTKAHTRMNKYTRAGGGTHEHKHECACTQKVLTTKWNAVSSGELAFAPLLIAAGDVERGG